MTRNKRKSTSKSPARSSLHDSLQRYQPLLSLEEFERLLEELKQPLHSAIRINSLKATAATAVPAWAEHYGWQLEPVPFCDEGFYVTAAQTSPSQTIEHKLGFYYIQDAASMLPVALFDLDPQAAPLILDLAASPGGKTTHLAGRTLDRGLIIANDSSQSRIQALRVVLQNWGTASVAVTRFPGELFGAWYPETFDKVLLDAPCSMEGLRATEAHPLRPITDKERTSLAHRQAALLESAFQAVKVGGQVVYSTCTLAPEEDEAVLESLLERYPAAVRVDDLRDKLPVPAAGLADYAGQAFQPPVCNAARLWPHLYHTAGFFAARITKTAPVATATQSRPERPWQESGLERLAEPEAKRLVIFFNQTYSFTLDAWLTGQGQVLMQRGPEVYVIPQRLFDQFATLPFQFAGLLLGELGPEGFVLSHDVAARLGLQFKSGTYCLPPEAVPAWLRGSDLLGALPVAYRLGDIVIVTDAWGRNLGRGKVLHDRLKNLLPRKMF
ncbi:MAG: NOL1/NOP2/sun family putative RNA methylase [Anaerolineaceae bacterium]|jgi:16S rRNA (cytosine1407-C5)-methyltransferase